MTPASDTKPTRRLARGSTTYDDLYVVELAERTITIRPKGTRSRGPAEVVVGIGVLYQKLMTTKVIESRKGRRPNRRVKRGVQL